MSHERPRLGRGNNWHHVFWQRSWYDTRIPLEQEFREHPALVIPMNERVHMSLHRELDAPLKPTHEQMERVLGALALWTPAQGRLGGVETAIDEFYALHEQPTDNELAARRAALIAVHLESQLEFMRNGPPVRHLAAVREMYGAA